MTNSSRSCVNEWSIKKSGCRASAIKDSRRSEVRPLRLDEALRKVVGGEVEILELRTFFGGWLEDLAMDHPVGMAPAYVALVVEGCPPLCGLRAF